MSKSKLKVAMDALQVSKPFRLSRHISAPAPAFTPPPLEIENSTGVQNQTQVGFSTPVENRTEVEIGTGVEFQTSVEIPAQVEKSTLVSKLTQVSNPTVVENKTQVIFQTPVEKSTQGENQTPVNSTTQVGNPTQVQEKTEVDSDESKHPSEQDASVVLEARAGDGLKRGYTRLPNEILMDLASGSFTRNEIKLALLIARFTISFQRKHAPLSKTVLERQSGLRGAAVLEALSGLVSKGLVEKQQGNQNRPNLLGLVLPIGWESPVKKIREMKVTQVENSTPVENPTPVEILTSAGVGNLTGAGVGNPTYFKDKERYLNINSLSKLPEPIQKYFSQLKPIKKKESEWNLFENLQTEYQVHEISDCLVLLLMRGVRSLDDKESFQPCHSPMAFLSRAMGEVLKDIREQKKKMDEKRTREEKELQEAELRLEAEKQNSAEWSQIEMAFEKTFLGEECQLEVLSELCQGSPFRPLSQVGRSFGLRKWWEGLDIEKRSKLLS